MNDAQWTALREYIAAEIKLGICRHLQVDHGEGTGLRIAALEKQSTRMETSIRGLVGLPANTSGALQGAPVKPSVWRNYSQTPQECHGSYNNGSSACMRPLGHEGSCGQPTAAERDE